MSYIDNSSLLGRHTLYRSTSHSRRFDTVKTPQMMTPLELTQTLTATYHTRHESSQPMSCIFLGYRSGVVEVVVLLGRLGALAGSCWTLKVATFQTFEHPALLGCDAVSMGTLFPTFRKGNTVFVLGIQPAPITERRRGHLTTDMTHTWP